MPFVTIDQLSAQTPDGRSLFEGLTLSLGHERTGLVGPNGSGKSTLIRIILGEASPRSGVVSRDGTLGVLRQRAGPPPGACRRPSGAGAAAGAALADRRRGRER